MDFSSVMQMVLTLMMGALCWFVQRSIKKFDDGIDKLDQRISAVDQKNSDEIKKLRQEFNDYLKDAPLVFTLREDFIRVMNNVDEKLNQLLYNRNGGNDS